MEEQIGINTEAIRKLCLDIQDYSDKIKNTLTQISDVWNDAKPSFEGYEKDIFNKKFSDIENYFDIIYENFSSYIDELNLLVSKYKTFDKDLSIQVKINAKNILEKEVKNG